MLGNEIIVVALLITGCYSADDNTKINNGNVTKTDAISNEPTVSMSTKLPVSTTTATESFPLLEDLVAAEKSATNNGDNDDGGDEKNNAKRTISGKFTGPIVVSEHETNLFTPADEFSRKQRINVQIIEPHNNGQFLKQTVFLRQENNTVVTTKTTTTSTTERPSKRKNIVVEQKFLAPIQVGLRLSNDARQRQLNDDDCDDPTDRANVIVTEKSNRVVENVDIQQNTKIQKIIYKDEPKQQLVFGARVASTTRPPCEQSSPCTTARPYRPSSTPRKRPFNTTPLPPQRVYTTPRIVTAARVVTTPVAVSTSFVSTPRIVTTPRIVSTPAAIVTSAVTPVHVPVRPIVTERPVYIHTHSESPVVQKEYIQLPPKIIEKPVIQKEFVQLPPQVHVVEKPRVVIQKELVHLPPQERIVPVEVEKLVVKEVPINNIIEKHIQHPPTIFEKLVPYPVASKPIEVEKIVHVPVDRVVEKPVQVNHVVEKPVAVPYVQYVDRPIHIPYILPVEIPIAYHVPYLVKPPPPPLPQKSHFIIKTTKFGKGHGLFDWKHNHLKHIKHVIIKKPNHILTDDIIAPPSIESIGLLPPPRFQPFISDDFGPNTAASINVVQAVLPNSVHGNHEQFFEPSPHHNSFNSFNNFGSYDNKFKFVDSFSKDIRWEYGFKPPLVPSVAIDEFGNPLHEH